LYNPLPPFSKGELPTHFEKEPKFVIPLHPPSEKRGLEVVRTSEKRGLEVVRSLGEGRKLQGDKSWQKDVFQFGF
jgi:hypothetical protein